MRISKRPEIRKQELMDVALKLFISEGYESVSVRDILEKVNGHPGMFYYYFKSKQEIYYEAMGEMIEREVKNRTAILKDKSKSIVDRFKELLHMTEEGIKNYYENYNNVEEIPYETNMLLNYLAEFAKPVSEFLIEAKKDGTILNCNELNESTAYSVALFLINGCHGLIHFNPDSSENMKYCKNFICGFLNVDVDKFGI